MPTLLDSIQAESRLPAVAMRRPLERYLGRFSDDRLLVRRISLAVLRESRRQQVPPSLITAVLLTENTTLRPDAESSVGAQGLMQVMPFHAGARLCNSADLVDVDSNICHGTLILARNLRATNTSVAALLRYNGCVRGTNTPDCHRYPGRVLARASVVRREILAATGRGGGGRQRVPAAGAAGATGTALEQHSSLGSQFAPGATLVSAGPGTRRRRPAAHRDRAVRNPRHVHHGSSSRHRRWRGAGRSSHQSSLARRWSALRSRSTP